MKCSFIIGAAAGTVLGMAAYALIEPMLPYCVKKTVKKGRRAITRAAHSMM